MGALRIGEVARRTGLSQRTLRHYDELGLLVPSGRSSADYRLYSHEDLVRLLAIQHLKSLGLSLGEVRSALDDPAVDAPAMLGQHAAAVERRIAAEQDLLGRLRALQSAAEAGWDDVLDAIALSERLRHPHAEVRLRAALTGHASAPFEDLVEVLRSDPEPGVREAATWAITQRPAGAAARLGDALASGDARARHALAHVLGKLRDPSAVPLLGELLRDDEADVAAKAAFSLGQVGGPGAVAALVAALGDQRPGVRDEVAAALAALDGAVEPLVAALSDPQPAVRALAAEALGLSREPTTVAALTALLSDTQPEVRFAALLALGQLDDEGAARAVEGEIDSPDDRARLLARRLVADRQAVAPAAASRSERKRLAT
ncbi:HEAT repeat domain-containing protein [Tessaracoccus sp. Z1128]